MTIPQRDFEWSLAPMYSIATNSINGFAKIGFDNGKIAIGLKGQRFASDDLSNEPANYIFARPYLTVNLLPNRIKKDVKASIGVEYLYAYNEFIRDRYPTWGNEIPPQFIDNYVTNLGRLTLRWSKKMLRSDVSWKSTLDVWSEDYLFSSNSALLHQHALSYNYVYRGKGKKAIRTRLYYGSSGYDLLLTASGQTGINDYAYDGLFLGRTEVGGLLSNQFMRNQGALAVPTNMMASKHLASLNVEFDLPVKFPLGVYGGAAFVSGHHLDPVWGSRFTRPYEEFIWNTGVTVPLIRNIFQIYVPVIYSNQIKKEFKARDLKFGETIMFELNLNLANPFEILKNLEL
jgi:hypothetical protein